MAGGLGTFGAGMSLTVGLGTFGAEVPLARGLGTFSAGFPSVGGLGGYGYGSPFGRYNYVIGGPGYTSYDYSDPAPGRYSTGSGYSISTAH